MAPLPVTLNLHCYECGHDVDVIYQPLPGDDGGRVHANEEHFLCPHCGRANAIDLNGPVIGAKKPGLGFGSLTPDLWP